MAARRTCSWRGPLACNTKSDIHAVNYWQTPKSKRCCKKRWHVESFDGWCMESNGAAPPLNLYCWSVKRAGRPIQPISPLQRNVRCDLVKLTRLNPFLPPDLRRSKTCPIPSTCTQVNVLLEYMAKCFSTTPCQLTCYENTNFTYYENKSYENTLVWVFTFF